MKINWLRTTIIAVFFSVLLLMGCSEPAQEFSMAPAQVSVMTLTTTPVAVTDVLPGRVAALRTAEIRAQVSGVVQHRLFEQGSEVKAGEPLFQINPAPFKADVDSAAAALQRAEASSKQARVQTERLLPLVKVGSVSKQVYDDAISLHDQAIADVAQAHATLTRRKLDLTFATVEAPIAGRIDQALVTEGALVGVSDSNPMARIQQIDQVYVDVRQPASALDALREALANVPEGTPGLPATILNSHGSPYPLAAHILFSGMNVDTGTGDVLIRILVENPQLHLLPGMFVHARVPRSSYPDALMVPQQAVMRADDGTKVWVVDKKNTVSSVAVQLGELVDHQYRIQAGLHLGQQIVVEGMERLAEGGEVAPRPWLGSSSTSSTTPR